MNDHSNARTPEDATERAACLARHETFLDRRRPWDHHFAATPEFDPDAEECHYCGGTSVTSTATDDTGVARHMCAEHVEIVLSRKYDVLHARNRRLFDTEKAFRYEVLALHNILARQGDQLERSERCYAALRRQFYAISTNMKGLRTQVRALREAEVRRKAERVAKR